MRIAFVLSVLICYIQSIAQTIINPVFDRTDQPSFHINKIELTKDTTFVFCTYFAEAESWANISSETYLEDVLSGNKYKILKSDGLPLAPSQRDFLYEMQCEVKLSFPYLKRNVGKLNLIETLNGNGFNIYGIDILDSFSKSYSEQDIDSLYKCAMKCGEKKEWKKAINFSLERIRASECVYGIHSVERSWPMYDLTQEYFGIKDYDKVIEWGEKAIKILSIWQHDSINMEVLARAYGNVGTAYYLKKEIDIANQFREKSLAVRRYVQDRMSYLNYEEYLRHLSTSYFYEENYPKALLYGKEVVGIYEAKYKENNVAYGCALVQALTNLCEYNHRIDNIDDAIECGEKALKLIQEGACQSSFMRNVTYNNLSAALSANGQVDKAIDYLQEIFVDSIDKNKEDERLFINSRMLLASLYLDYKQDTVKAANEYEYIQKEIENNTIQDYKYEYIEILRKLYKAKRPTEYDARKYYLKKILEVQKEWHGEKSLAYANSLLDFVNNTFIASILNKEGTDSLISYLRMSTDIIKRHFANSVYNMSKNERNLYWQRYKKVFIWLIPTICGIVGTDEAKSLVYDTSLFYKGLLLSSEIEIKDIIYSCNDSSLISLYNEYVNDLAKYENLLSFVSSSITIDSLKTKIRDEEILLSRKVSEFDRQLKGTNYSWKEVRNKLKEDEVAIEFVSYDSMDGLNVYYDAYLISHDSECPHYIDLFVENNLKDSIRINNINYNKLSKLIWGNEELKSAIHNSKNIYFSTSGLLNAIGIEYLPIEGGGFINEKYNLYRLSSTRELCHNSDRSFSRKAYLYGGLNYDADIVSISRTNKKYKTRWIDRLSRGLHETINHRAGFSILENTKYEVNQIKSILDNSGYLSVIFENEEGTEESIKALSGNPFAILHIATHGMYIEVDDASELIKDNNLQFVKIEDGVDVTQEENILTRSFLVMSGGNMLIRRDSISSNMDDGFLTAKEISKLDFKELDLVVLSACQTGLGEIESEGVYGLQRGFKKAGVNTILMSLDKVDDEATKILMVEFYRNLMNGKTKRQSLQEAQQHLRNVENGKYDDPKYWASFIMLDGLN